MGDWTGTVPTILAGDIVSGDDWDNVTDELSAISGAWTTWSPTLANLTLGNGTVTAKYRRVGKTVDFKFRFQLGSTSAVGTEPSFTLPATPATDHVSTTFDDIPVGEGRILDFGTTLRPAVMFVFSGSAATIRYVEPTANNMVAINATTPWTWTTSDTLALRGTYETT